ncbi:hypothetical protein BXZ70DRAFT_1004444 [Cristinia sonorae]|uniref:Metal homeostatis protein bsd2 n=1 Tax=Cristinia sonorae TaxID=1940300 RepID=A0A8K0XTT9_9AGAR|nr:hypothetical protein BXZ70DRAFT_1004444 [Cristinia sonorae]
MSSARYAPLPNPHTDPHRDNELEAAFDDSGDEDDDLPPSSDNNRNGGYHALANDEPAQPPSPQRPTTYDFENVDYDYIRPPPGSPPGPSTRALPNEWGNSNGLVPSFTAIDTDAQRTRGGWFRRTAQSVLPSHYVQRFGLAPQVPTRAVGDGLHNDGVFANVTAKPTRPRRIQDGDETILVPEEASKEAPPSYAVAQADAAPSYWETTIHAPSSSNSPGEMIIDGLQTGSLFSFLWNMLVSISFQFVGFLLTYLLHTTHAAKLGSRAGLGVTLIQYGFAMRSKADDWAESGSGWVNGTESGGGWWKSTPSRPSFDTAAEADLYYKNLNETMGIDLSAMQEQTNQNKIFGDIASEWLSFFLMTIGWFLLLTSLLGYWRVKRWESSILSSSTPAPAADPSTAGTPSFFRAFNINNTLLRQGLVFPGSAASASATSPRTIFDSEEDAAQNEPELLPNGELRGAYVIPVDGDPDRTHRLARAFADEARLQRDLRAAGLL